MQFSHRDESWPTFLPQSLPEIYRSDSGMFFLESWWRFFFGRISLFKTVPCKIEIRIFPGTDIWVEVSRKVHTASLAIHGAIQESLEIMLDNVTWQSLSTRVRTCHVSHIRTWRCNAVQHFLSAFDQPLMLRESTQHALLPSIHFHNGDGLRPVHC